MIALLPTALADTYPTANNGMLLGPSGLGLGLEIIVANNPAVIRVASYADAALGIGGDIRLTDEFYLPPTSKTYDGAIGFTARNAVKGSVSVVAADVYEKGDPTPVGGVQFSGALAISGAFTPSPTVGQELGYSEIVANVSVTATTAATATLVVTAPAITFDGSMVALVAFFCANMRSAANDNVTFVLYDNGVNTGILLGRTSSPDAANTGDEDVSLSYRFTPTAGAHTYSVRAFVAVTATTLLAAPPWSPTFVRITQAV